MIDILLGFFLGIAFIAFAAIAAFFKMSTFIFLILMAMFILIMVTYDHSLDLFLFIAIIIGSILFYFVLSKFFKN